MEKMTKELRDEYIGNFALKCDSTKFWDICRGISEPIMAFYDNQIDNVCEWTMENLKDAFNEIMQENSFVYNEIYESMKEDFPEYIKNEPELFVKFIAFYLLLDGAIKQK